MENDVKFEVTAGFFDAINNDRVYSADDMNRPYRKLISNGINITITPDEKTHISLL